MHKTGYEKVIGSRKAISWNPAVSCFPALARISEIPRFAPGISNKRALTPPCSIQDKPAFVEIDNVVLVNVFVVSLDGDYTFNIEDDQDPNPNPYMRRIHCEIDSTWINARIAPSISLPINARIDVQGFVYLDPNHVGESWHNYSPYEIHPVTAWRLHI